MDRELQQIPFNAPIILDEALDYIRQTVHGMHTSGDGPFTQKYSVFLLSNFAFFPKKLRAWLFCGPS